MDTDERPVSPVVRCRVCGHVAPLREMKESRPVRVFDYQRRRLPADERWVCRDMNACHQRFK